MDEIRSKFAAFFAETGAGKKKPTLKELRKRFAELVGKLDTMAKSVYIGLLTLVILLAPWLVGFFIMLNMGLNGTYSLPFALSQSPVRYMMIGLFPGVGLATTLGIYLLVILIMMATIIARSPELSPISETDDRGVSFAKDYSYGSAKWMSREEAEEKFTVAPIEDTEGYILGQFTEDGRETISRSTKASGNQNYMVIGSPGRGKTYCFGFNAVLQSLKRGESLIVVDPKGELFEKTSATAEKLGYVVKVYNLNHPERSNAWNFASEIFDVDTGNLDSSRLTKFVDVVMTNTMDGEKEDGFWGPGERNLFQAVTAFVGWQFENKYTENINFAADKWENIALPLISEEERDRLFAIIRNTKSNLRDKEDALRAVIKSSGLASDAEIDSYIKDIKDASDPVTIDRIFSLFVKHDLNGLLKLFADNTKGEGGLPSSHPAGIAWNIFAHSDAKIQPNFILGLSQRLKLFANTDINSMSAHDDINFYSIGERKTVIYCIIDDKDSSRKLLSSLFFSFLFRDVADAADRLGADTRLPVNVICDEFANVGRIPDFERFIAVVRSRKIYITIIIQSIAQLAKVYDENDRETIMECCDTVLFLGCNGTLTAEFISNLSGVSTIITGSIRDTKNVSGMRGLAQGYTTSEGAGKRNLITPDEAMRLEENDVLIFSNASNVLKAHRCGYPCHPYVKRGMVEERPLRLFPTTEEMYGAYGNIFDKVCAVNLQQQKAWNEMEKRLDGAVKRTLDSIPMPNTFSPRVQVEEPIQGPVKQPQPTYTHVRQQQPQVRQEEQKQPIQKPSQQGEKVQGNPKHRKGSVSDGQLLLPQPDPYASMNTPQPARKPKPNKKKPPEVNNATKDITGIGNTFNARR